MMGIFNRRKTTEAKKSFTTLQMLPQLTLSPTWREFSKLEATTAFSRSTWLYACIRLRAVNIASVPFIAQRKRGDDWEPEEGELQRVLDRPNTMFDWSSMIRRAMMLMDLSGDAFFTKIRVGNGRTRQLWPQIVTYATIKRSGDEMYYEFQIPQASRRVVPAGDVLHLRFTHPTDLFFGLSPLQAAARAVDIDEESESWQKKTLENMAVPPFGLSMEGEFGQEEYEQHVRWIREQSGPENARKPWVLGNLKVHQLAQSAVDIDWLQGRKFSREEICAAYSTPPPLVGIYENATLANIETARQILWMEGLIPVLDEITEQMTLQIASEYGDDYRITYDLGNVEALRENLGEKLDDAVKLRSLGVPLAVINQRLELGLTTDEIEGSEIAYIPSGLFPVGIDLGDNVPGNREEAELAFGGDNGE
jgi:HK97 family phage portal protein